MPGVNESFTLLQHSFSPETKQTISKGVVFFPHHLPFVVFYLYDFSFVVVLFEVIFKSFRVVKSKYITHQLQRNARFTKTVFINPVNVLAFSTDGKLQLQHLDQVTLLLCSFFTGRFLDPIARKELWQNGLDYRHGTGHGIGMFLGVHEGVTRQDVVLGF